MAATTGDTIASIIYTSGTTGRPKGCVLTHGQLLGTARQADIPLTTMMEPEDACTLLFLPLAHVFARIIRFALLDHGTVIGYARSPETLTEDLRSFKPTFLLTVPRIFEKVFVSAQRQAQGRLKARVFEAAVTTAQLWSSSAARGPLLSARRMLFERLVYRRLRAALGGRLAYCISGGAPLAPHLANFFGGLGIEVLQGYGLTETCAANAVNTPEWNKVGTVGQPWPGFEFRVAEDGELLIAGVGVFQGYWRNQAATNEALSEDRWFHTGDLGTIDDDGFVTVTGRKKEIIVTAGGKDVAPAALEERLKSWRLISQAMVVGDNRPFVAALVTLDSDELAAFAREHDLSGDLTALKASGPVQAEVNKAVAHANATVSRPESIRNTVVLDRDSASLTVS